MRNGGAVWRGDSEEWKGLRFWSSASASRLRDFAAYIAIGLCLGLACIWFAYHKVDSKWLVLAFETCLVFGCTIGWSRRLWRQPAFWVSLGFFLAIHLTGFVVVLQRISIWRAPWVGATFAIETSLAITLCEVAVAQVETRKRRRRKIHPS